MSKIKKILAGTAVCLALASPVAAQEVDGDTVVATVGETDITIGHMIAMAATLPQDQRQLPLDVIFEGVMERLIQQEAISQSQTDMSKMTMLQIENERRSLVASEVVNDLAAGVEVSDDAVQAAYDSQYASATPQTEYDASHILVDTEEEAKAIVTELRDGADFAELAKQKSTGPSGPSGGNLGWFGTGRMVPEFEAAVAGMKKGEISDPVQTQFGWHVIKLNDTRELEVPTFEDVRTELEQEVWRDAMEEEIKVLVDAVSVERADVSAIDPTVLTDFSLIGN